jgi:hypothetical protein
VKNKTGNNNVNDLLKLKIFNIDGCNTPMEQKKRIQDVPRRINRRKRVCANLSEIQLDRLTDCNNVAVLKS